MSHNTFGHLFRVTTFGESHGLAIGCVVDGCPPLIPLEEADIQQFLDQRRPGQSRFTTQRQEAGQVKILSGVFHDEKSKRQVTTGTPIALLIENTDQRSKDYDEIKDTYRPGHADFTYDLKYWNQGPSRRRPVFRAGNRHWYDQATKSGIKPHPSRAMGLEISRGARPAAIVVGHPTTNGRMQRLFPEPRNGITRFTRRVRHGRLV